jgi:hypothetical protein
MQENRDILTLEEAERMSWDVTDTILAECENNDPAARERLFSTSLLIFLKHFSVLPPRAPNSRPRANAFMGNWGIS